jgi:hypothetical protein
MAGVPYDSTDQVLVTKQASGKAKIDALAATFEPGSGGPSIYEIAIFLFCDAEIAE